MSADMVQIFSEFIGTLILIVLGDGVCAAVNLNKSKAQNSGWIVIAFGWALAVTIAVYVAGINGPAHLNPAVTIAMAVNGSLKMSLVFPFIIAQLLGAIVGAVLVWLAYLPHFDATTDKGSISRGKYTLPNIPALVINVLLVAVKHAAK